MNVIGTNQAEPMDELFEKMNRKMAKLKRLSE